MVRPATPAKDAKAQKKKDLAAQFHDLKESCDRFGCQFYPWCRCVQLKAEWYAIRE